MRTTCKECKKKLENPHSTKLYCNKKCADKHNHRLRFQIRYNNDENFRVQRKIITKKWIENNREKFNKLILSYYYKKKEKQCQKLNEQER